MQKTFLTIASISAMLAVILGAFGAHALKARLSADQLQVFETGVRYQYYHTFALFVVAILLSLKYQSNAMIVAGWCFTGGMILFSCSLYMLSIRDVIQLQNWRWLGPITPLGGLVLIAGWISLLMGILKSEG